ncbi:unnamed protein product [Leptidea sinapis]|uniref:Cyclic nucleotide-binding domain-containing protein n=1 Tax=Leptidea sinapis TaxID=189913 RepID=A0A5E4R8H3_9NEOP|nr:unnamed protein product [Leptidea sinapis]
MVYMIYVGEFSNIIQYYSFRSFAYYSKIIELEHPIFRSCEAKFLRQLVGCLQLHTHVKGMYVVKEKEITDSLYIVHTGRVLESTEDRETTRLYFAGETFGTSQILTLCLKDWEHLLDHFPNSRDVIEKSFIRHDDKPDDTSGHHRRRVTIVNDRQSYDNGKDMPEPNNATLNITDPTIKHEHEVTQAFNAKELLNAPESLNEVDLNDDQLINKLDTGRRRSSETPEAFNDALLLNEEEEATEALLAKIESPENNVLENNINSTEPPENDLNKQNLDYSVHLHSVDEYFMERYELPHTSSQADDASEELSNEPTSTMRMKQGFHVRYGETDETVRKSSDEYHELKPIRIHSTESRDDKTLDSDVYPNKNTDIDILSIASNDTYVSESQTDQEKDKIIKKKLKED